MQFNKQQVSYYNENNKVIFSKLVRENSLTSQSDIYTLPRNATKKAPIYKKTKKSKSKIYNSFLGKHYREHYYKDYTYSIALHDTLFGGLNPIKLGGGNQSISLRLIDNQGKEYVMRQMSKSATQFIQVKVFKEQYLKDKLKTQVPNDY